jgi:hypothetical protein
VSRRSGLWLILGLAAFYTLLGNGRITRGDGETMFQVTRALAERGELALPAAILPPSKSFTPYGSDAELAFTVSGHDGRTYSKYGLGQSLAALPLYWIGMGWRALTGTEQAPRLAAALLNGLLTAAAAGALLALARDLGQPRQTSLLLALIFAVCTPAWPYTHTFFSEPLVTLCLVVAALGAVRFARREQSRWLALMGGGLGLALLARIDAVAALPGFALYLAATWRALRPPWRTIAGQAAIGAIAFGLGLGLVLLHNVARSGSPLDFGYRTANWETPFFVGLYGLTLSPGKGALWYIPPIWAGLAGAPSFARRLPREALLCAGVVLGYLLIHSPYTYWEGGWCWGPRLILPAVPFALLPAGPLLARHQQKQTRQLVLALLLGLGFLVQVPAVGADYERTLQIAYDASPDDFYEWVVFQLPHSPLFGQWRSLMEVTSNLRSPAARAQLQAILAETRRSAELLLANSPAEALYLTQKAVLAINLPDLWLVSGSWLRGTGP